MYKIYFILVLCVCSKDALSNHHNEDRSSDLKIVGGYDTNIQDFPYQVHLRLKNGKNFYQCGGSIVTKRHVLTAANCLERVQKIYATIGSVNSDSGGTTYSTKRYTRHPKYNARNLNNDIAVIEMVDDMKLDGVNTKAISLAQKGSVIPPGTMINVTGWGATSENGESSRTLRAVEVPTLSNSECSEMMGGIHNGKLCAGVAAGGKDSCQEDSGGPAVLNGQQVGIVSYGNGCARPNSPGVYTNISFYADWIKMNTKL